MSEDGVVRCGGITVLVEPHMGCVNDICISPDQIELVAGESAILKGGVNCVEKVAALLSIKSMAVVSGVPRNQYGDDHALIPGIKVLYTYGETNRGGLGVRVARALKRDGVAVLFSDVPPFTMHRYPMETVGVSMFGRDARIHNGVFRMGETFGAVLLPFYLQSTRNR